MSAGDIRVANGSTEALNLALRAGGAAGRASRQWRQTAQAVARYFPPGTRLTMTRGGLSLWGELPGGLSATALLHAALKENMVIAPGTIFTNSARFESHLRVNCGWPFTPDIDRAFERLGQLVGGLAQT